MKNGLKYLLLALAIILLQINVFGQNIDSLKLELKKASHDTTRCNILSLLVEITDDSEWPIYNEKLRVLSEKSLANNSTPRKFYLKHLSNSLNNFGLLANQKGDNIKALDYLEKSLKISEEINDNAGVAYTAINCGQIYFFQGDVSKSLEYLHKGLKISEKINDKKGAVTALINIGFIYGNQGDVMNALGYYKKCLVIYEELGNKKGVSTCLDNIGSFYKQQGNEDMALYYHLKALKISEEIGDKRGMASIFNNIGVVYDKQGNFEKTIEYLYKSLNVSKEVGYKFGESYSLSMIAKLLAKKGQINDAYILAVKGMELSKELGLPDNIKRSAETLKLIFQKQNKHKEALAMYELEIQMRDSINNAETKKASIKKQFQYQYEKKAAADSVKVSEEKKVFSLQLKQEKTQRIALYSGLALVLLFSVFMVNRFRVTNKQKQIIELKEQETQKQNLIITEQKHLVEEKHKEITDSINYAERIQRSFLATKELLDENLKNYFVLFKPKDVVSGDFYWASTLNNGNFALVTADSTGHGVPGAIMSLLNITSLEKAIEDINNPNEILNHTRTTIISRLKKDGSEHGGKDGMDASLIVFDFKQKQLHIAAANNPVWIVRDSSLIEVKPDKMPVGKHDKDTTPFTQQTIDIQTGDVIYAITDGYPDQFGGEKGKKFMSKNLKELLQANAHIPMEEQKILLDTTFKNWVGDLEQVDDVTVIGIRI